MGASPRPRLLTPARNLAQLQRDLIMAGLVGKLTVTDFLGLRFLVGAGLSAAVFLTTSLNRPVASAILIAFAFPMVANPGANMSCTRVR